VAYRSCSIGQSRCARSSLLRSDVLEGAHITPYKGPLWNDVTNGLLLRSDLHTLFDCYLLAIHPDLRRVVIADAMKGSTYVQIADRRLRPPVADTLGPSKRTLQKGICKV
jgi:putative restriction endonuclease